MIKIRKSEQRGLTKTDWLESKHTFSFGRYYDEEHMGFGTLRVINEDKVNANTGFGTHQHQNMEIISYVLSGSLKHEDSLGTNSVIKPGEIQRMSAGTGIRHSEFNPLSSEKVHFLQIWIIPAFDEITPSYEQKNFSQVRQSGKLTLVVSKEGREGSLRINQEAEMYILDLDPTQNFNWPVPVGRQVWVQVTKGSVSLNDQVLHQGDGAAVIKEKVLSFQALEVSELLIFTQPATRLL